MRVARAKITDFRSITDSGWVVVDDIACLVGKNESGKTNFLQALARMNPPEGVSDAFDLTDDFPRRRLSDIEEELKKEGAPSPIVITVEYELDEADVRMIETSFGKGSLLLETDRRITATKDYKSHKVWTFSSDDQAVVRHLVQRFDLDVDITAVTTPAALRAAIEALEETEESNRAGALALIDSWGSHGYRGAIAALLRSREPLFVYYSDYERMAGDGNVRELIAMRGRRSELDGPQRTFLALLDMAKADLNDLDEGAYNALKARLEAASIKITDQLYNFWRQNTNSEIEIDHDRQDRPGQPNQSDLILKVRVRDKRHALSVPVDQRSNGFVWFFSFLVNFSRIQDAYPGHPLVLLLDEPGTALHGLAQQDFLRVVDDRLSDHQVLYTTHQPFLVDPNRIDRARPVVDDPRHGTLVANNAYKIDRDTLFPLQAALGYEIGQTLFVAPNALLVEGTSDLVYLQVMSRAAEAQDQAGLDRRWTVTPVGGVDKMDTFARLFASNHLNIAALIDVTGNKKAKVEKLIESGDMQADHIVRLADFADGEFADIEDLFDVKTYVSLVQGAAADNPMMRLINAESLPEGDPRITRRIDELLKSLDQPRMDHLPPARYLQANQSTLIPKIPKSTVTRFVKLFGRINALLPG